MDGADQDLTAHARPRPPGLRRRLRAVETILRRVTPGPINTKARVPIDEVKGGRTPTEAVRGGPHMEVRARHSKTRVSAYSTFRINSVVQSR